MRIAHKRTLGNARRGVQMDADQVHAVMQDPKKRAEMMNQPLDLEQIGMAQHFCLPCAQYFADEHALKGHSKGSRHRKRMKVLKEKPYSHAEADMAVGIGRVKELATVPQVDEPVAVPGRRGLRSGGDVVMAQQ